MRYLNFSEIAIEIAREAGKMLSVHFNDVHSVRYKGDLNNTVSEVDQAVENYITSQLHKFLPEHSIVGEENGLHEYGRGFQWHVDPLDGTNNYLHGFPYFCISLGLVDTRLPEQEQLLCGVIYNPILNEMFWANKNDGAFLNGQRISVSNRSTIETALIVIDFPYSCKKHPRTIIDNIERFMTTAQCIRTPGASALDLAHVSCGRCDAYVQEGLESWDACAGTLLVREAGGIVSNFDGQFRSIPVEHIVASNGFLHEQVIDMVKGTYRTKEASTKIT